MFQGILDDVLLDNRVLDKWTTCSLDVNKLSSKESEHPSTQTATVYFVNLEFDFDSQNNFLLS